jgi:hypothetical protein
LTNKQYADYDVYIGGLLNNPQKKIAGAGNEPASAIPYQTRPWWRERSQIMARTRSPEHPMPPEGSWIKYQLDLRNIKLETVARKANRSTSMVSQVITGVKNSEAVGLALARTLGYATYQDLMEAASTQAKGGAA